jgi:Platelet-activating factor acetylhydrolase, isoform II
MGHSYGGITALGASAKCKLANAVIALDPWFFPHLQDDDIATADH